MKLTINTEVIKTLNPCKDRLDNWLFNYTNRDYSLRKFLALPEIIHSDKLWVTLRLVDNDTRVIFALDCAFSADAADAAYADAAYAAYCAAAAADTAAAAADTAAAAADYATYAANAAANAYAYAGYADADAIAFEQEQSRQLEALVYLIEGDL